MSLIGNVIWLVFGGLIASIGCFVSGLGFAITIIGIPVAMPFFKLARAYLTPFGKRCVTRPEADDLLYWIANVIWCCSFGLAMAVNHLFWAFWLGISIVGIPFAKQHLKLIPISLLPFGRGLA